MNINNILLTGQIKAGKSTILNKSIQKLNLSPTGFKTLPYLINNEVTGFYITDSLSSATQNAYSLIGKKKHDGKWSSIPDTFNIIGTQILNKSLNSNKKVILMDELGFFETKALTFQEYVFNCLNSNKIVIGAIKPIHTTFLNQIRNRKDIIIIEVNIDNRQKQYHHFKNILKEMLI